VAKNQPQEEAAFLLLLLQLMASFHFIAPPLQALLG